eukprot:5847910-Amphidinium_carterae.1
MAFVKEAFDAVSAGADLKHKQEGEMDWGSFGSLVKEVTSLTGIHNVVDTSKAAGEAQKEEEIQIQRLDFKRAFPSTLRTSKLKLCHNCVASLTQAGLGVVGIPDSITSRT